MADRRGDRHRRNVRSLVTLRVVQASHTRRSVSVNLMKQNQMALHAQNGCTKSNSSLQTGTNGTPNCTEGAGCTVLETNTNSVGAAFASAQGGVWATQFDVTGQFCLILPIV